MNRLIKTLALAAFGLAGAFAATTAQASATNFNVSFLVHNGDPSVSMQRVTDPMPTTITGIGSVAAIPPGGNDPSTGNATYSDTLPTLNQTKSVSFVYGQSGGGANCTFTIAVSRDSNVQPYLLHFSTDASACTVPGDVRSSNGQFTSQVYQLTWKSS